MNSLTLYLILVLFFNLTLASLLDFRVTSGSPCASVCNTVAQGNNLISEEGALCGVRVQSCLTCLQESGYLEGEDHEHFPKLLAARKEICAEGPRPTLFHRTTPPPSIHRRATPASSLSKGAIAGIAIGITLALAIAASISYLIYRRYTRLNSEDNSIRSWKGPRRTTSSLDFRCRTRVTPMASRVDFRRLHMGDAGVEGNEKRRSGVQPGDALGSNPVLSSTLGETPAASPHTGTESSWNGQTLCSTTQSPPYRGSIKWASPTVPSPRTPAPTYSPHRGSPYTLSSATPSSTKASAPLLPAKAMYTPPKYGSVSPPSSYHSAESGYRPLYPSGGEIWEGPPRALRTQRGRWDLHARSLEQGRGGADGGYAGAEIRGYGEHQDV